MPCRQQSQFGGATGFGSGAGGYATEAECLEACKEGACCTGTTCTVKPQCQCNAAAGEVFKGVGTVCSPNPCTAACCVNNECFVKTADECAAAGGRFIQGGTCDGRCPCVSGASCLAFLSESLSPLFCSPLIFPSNNCTGGTTNFGITTPRICRHVIEDLTDASGFGSTRECAPFANIKVIRSRVGRPPEEGEPWLAVGLADRTQVIGSAFIIPFSDNLIVSDYLGIPPYLIGGFFNEQALRDVISCGVSIVKDEIRLIGNQADSEHVIYALDGSPSTLWCRRYKTQYRVYLSTGEEVTSEVTNYPEMLFEGTTCGADGPTSLNGTDECPDCALPGFGEFNEFFPDVVFPCAPPSNPLP